SSTKDNMAVSDPRTLARKAAARPWIFVCPAKPRAVLQPWSTTKALFRRTLVICCLAVSLLLTLNVLNKVAALPGVFAGPKWVRKSLLTLGVSFNSLLREATHENSCTDSE